MRRQDSSILRRLNAILEDCDNSLDAEDVGEAILGITRNIIQRTPLKVDPKPVISPEQQKRDVLSEIENRFGSDEKIPAIRFYREHINAGLKEAKDAVETLSMYRRY